MMDFSWTAQIAKMEMRWAELGRPKADEFDLTSGPSSAQVLKETLSSAQCSADL